MIRYKLDDLGWYQFEWLVQALLKSQLGMGLESWGGRGDHGRDAWCHDPLPFPARRTISSGPFLFQVKFVENANAAGAKPWTRLLSAVKAEVAEIRRRQAKSSGSEIDCSHYTLVTNCLISPDQRTQVRDEIAVVLPGASVHSLGGSDVCDLLDESPTLKRSFPQLLSLQDLETLLSKVVNRELVSRSSAAISHATAVRLKVE
jgi:hypothetical protein